MTSMPASRRARAMILAPRSCPSRPGLATTTRIFLVLVPASIGPASLLLDSDIHGHLVVDGADDRELAGLLELVLVSAAVRLRRGEVALAVGDGVGVVGRAAAGV